jgi:molybdenum cofactor biosynthesis enzyme MoaA
MTATNRLYINLTNKCNTACSFCCMFSSPNKNIFMDFDTFKKIVDTDHPECNFELQLEGGEPLLHPDFYLFLEYARSTKRCNKIVLTTNGILLTKNLQRITDFVAASKIKFLVKCSINYHLYSLDNKLFKKSRDLFTATEFIENFEVRFNVRLRKEDDWIIEKLKENKIFELSNIYELQNYGRMNDERYVKPFIVQNIDNWNIYSCDGVCFGKDLIARSEYERNLK